MCACILTKAAQQFVTPLSAGAHRRRAGVHRPVRSRRANSTSAISGSRARADLIVVAPATADLMAKMAHGLADDLASAVLLATRAKILLAPAMNPQMWAAKATQRNLAQLVADGVATDRPERRRDGGSERARLRPHGGAAGDRRRRREVAQAARPAHRQARADHVGPDARADRSGALHRQPLVRQAGPRDRRRGGGGRRRCDAGQRAGECARSTAAFPSSRSKARATCWPRSRRRCRPTSRSSPPRSPTGASPMPARRRSRRRRARARPNCRSPKIPTSSRPSRIAPESRPKLVIGFAAETQNVARQCQGEARAQRLRLDPRQ